jgi:hypothetical protein
VRPIVQPGRCGRMRQDGPGDDAEQEQRVARFARQALPARPVREKAARQAAALMPARAPGLRGSAGVAPRRPPGAISRPGRRRPKSVPARSAASVQAASRDSRSSGAIGPQAVQSSQSSWRAETLVSRLTSSARSRAPAPPSSRPPASSGRRGGRRARPRSRRSRCDASGSGRRRSAGPRAARARCLRPGIDRSRAAGRHTVQARNRPSGKRVSALSVGTSCRPRACRHEADVRRRLAAARHVGPGQRGAGRIQQPQADAEARRARGWS